MNDTRNITIAVLCVTATILAVALILMHLSTKACADTPVAGGDYIMVTGAYSSAVDILYVVDQRQGKLNAYAVDRTRNRFEPREQIDLRKLFRTSR